MNCCYCRVRPSVRTGPGRRLDPQAGRPGRGAVPGARRSSERARGTVTPVDAAAHATRSAISTTRRCSSRRAPVRARRTALVDRVVSLIARGRVGMRELAAITFTEAAAGELRDRIRVPPRAGRPRPGVLPEERERCRVALDDVDDAALSTLHGFAQRILAEHPLAAGLPPRLRGRRRRRGRGSVRRTVERVPGCARRRSRARACPARRRSRSASTSTISAVSHACCTSTTSGSNPRREPCARRPPSTSSPSSPRSRRRSPGSRSAGCCRTSFSCTSADS